MKMFLKGTIKMDVNDIVFGFHTGLVHTGQQRTSVGIISSISAVYYVNDHSKLLTCKEIITVENHREYLNFTNY